MKYSVHFIEGAKGHQSTPKQKKNGCIYTHMYTHTKKEKDNTNV